MHYSEKTRPVKNTQVRISHIFFKMVHRWKLYIYIKANVENTRIVLHKHMPHCFYGEID